jgi:sugar phosphate permease
MVRTLRYRWVIFGILAFGYLLVYFHRLCTGVVALDMSHDLRAGGALTGLLVSAYFFAYASVQVPAGLLSDSWGPRRTITLFLFLAALGSVVVGVAPTAAWVIGGRLLVGLGTAMVFVCTLKAQAEWFHPREFATMTGILIAMGGVGSLTAAAPFALLSSGIGWRYAFIASGGATVVMAGLVWVFVRDRPASLGLPSPVESASRPAERIPLREGVRTVLACGWFWPLAVWFFLVCGIFFSFSAAWGPPYLSHVYGYSKEAASRIISLLYVGMIIGSPAFSVLSNRVFRGRKPVVVLASMAGLVPLALLAFATDRLSEPVLCVVCFATGVSFNAIVSIAFTMAKELFPISMAGTATGLVNLFPFAGGAALQPIIGAILDSHATLNAAGQQVYGVAGYRDGFLLLFACGIGAVIASLCLKETFPKR